MTSRSVSLLLFFSVWQVSGFHKCNVEFVIRNALLGKFVVQSDDSCEKFNRQGKKLVHRLTGYFSSNPIFSETKQNADFRAQVFPLLELQLPLEDDHQQLIVTSPWAIQRFLRLWVRFSWELKIRQKTSSKSSNSHQSLVFETTAEEAEELYSRMNDEFVSVSTSTQPHHRATPASVLGLSPEGSKSSGGSRPRELLVLSEAVTSEVKAANQLSSVLLPGNSLTSQSSTSALSRTTSHFGQTTCKVQFVVGKQLFANFILRLNKPGCITFDSTASFRAAMKPFFRLKDIVYTRVDGPVPNVHVLPLAAELFFRPVSDILTVSLKAHVLITQFLVSVLGLYNWKFVKATEKILRLENCADELKDSIEKLVQQLMPNEALKNDFDDNFRKLRRHMPMWGLSPKKYVVLKIRVGYEFGISALFKVERGSPRLDFWEYEPLQLIAGVYDGGYQCFDIKTNKWQELKFLEGHSFEEEDPFGDNDSFYTLYLRSAEKLQKDIEDLVRMDLSVMLPVMLPVPFILKPLRHTKF